MMKTPILLIMYNRPDVTEKIFQSIRSVKPQKIFISADGPRYNYPVDVEKCAQTRQIINKIDWQCDVKTNFSELNLGSKLGPASAISWFFSQVEEGIILEYDCLPDPSFYQFCETLLSKYRDNEKIMHISGNNYLFGKVKISEDYYFSAIPLIWGWATWKRAWKHYDVNLSSWPTDRIKVPGNLLMKYNWKKTFKKIYNKEIETWDYQWTYTLFKHNGMAITPAKNLVSNIGFGEEAVFSKNISSIYSNLPSEKMVIKNHPSIIKTTLKADRSLMKNHFNMTLKSVLKRFIKKIVKH